MTQYRSSTLFIHAPNIHTGGGRSLLRAVLHADLPSIPRTVLIDSRLSVPPDLPAATQLLPFDATLRGRLSAERRLASEAKPGDLVLCLGNLPPLFAIRCNVVVFLQNRLLVADTDLSSFPLRVRARLLLERRWLSSRASRATAFVVQTPTMERLLTDSAIARTASVKILPFVENAGGWCRSLAVGRTKDHDPRPFLYVATGEPHKNHAQLIEAWKLLAADGIFPGLRLTLDPVDSPDLCHWIAEESRKHGLQVTCSGRLSPSEISELYASSAALIYPSLVESLGLPLIEGRQAGLPVLASELDYVRDVLDPDESFNPDSAVSIAHAVKRFIGAPQTMLPVVDAIRFLETLWHGYR